MGSLCGRWRQPLGSMASSRRLCWVYNLPGLFGYQRALEWQRTLRKERISAARSGQSLPDVLILLEHPPVYTLGANSSIANLKFDPQDPKYELHRVERGGEVTYHGPGQLVGYPILNLTNHKKDLRWYLQSLEKIIIRSCQEFGVDAWTEPGLTGVWSHGGKIAAVGVAASRWITMHGFAFNIDPNLRDFERIVPCGIENRAVTSLAQMTKQGGPTSRRTLSDEGLPSSASPVPCMHGVREVVLRHFEKHFDVETVMFKENL